VNEASCGCRRLRLGSPQCASIAAALVVCSIYVGMGACIVAVMDHIEGDLWVVREGTKSFDLSIRPLQGREKHAALSTPGAQSADHIFISLVGWRRLTKHGIESDYATEAGRCGSFRLADRLRRGIYGALSAVCVSAENARVFSVRSLLWIRMTRKIAINGYRLKDGKCRAANGSGPLRRIPVRPPSGQLPRSRHTPKRTIGPMDDGILPCG